MQFALNLLLVVQILSALAMVGLILMQHGKGADAGAAFGGGGGGGAGGSASLFGASGGANFLSRTTAVLAAVFLGTTLALAYFGFSVPKPVGEGGSSVLEREVPDLPVPATAVPAPAAQPAQAPAVGVDAIPKN
ncbi:MAG: preprotein translocase subunit SecG [Proteobacteria bacterium]|nr:preprotein translocase subunit SecG [Pseudomonadota bacterium]MDA0867952.1 preprotein translocase subunit SecG [Pseudomonadota bacterium]MDA1328141.1 preprotein translocase subunit SecG [Pseudomonadota bacterium]